MNREQIIAALDEEIGRLHQVRKLLLNAGRHNFGSSVTTGKSAAKRVLSADARQRIAAAQKRRWAKHRKEAAAAQKK
jgi:hypothetical protein